MEIKIVNSPIGNFSSVYGELGLKKLIYIDKDALGNK